MPKAKPKSLRSDADLVITTESTRDRTAAALAFAHVDESAAEFLRRSQDDLARLGTMIGQACRGDAAALKEVKHIAHKLKGGSAMLGAHGVSVLAEAIEQLASGVLANLDAHGPIADSALVQQLSELIDALAIAVQVRTVQIHAAPACRERQTGPVMM